MNPRISIPPGDPNYEVDSKFTLQDDATLEMLLPHMHLRGKDFEYTVIFPDGRKEELLSVPNYSFSWQLSYYLDKPLLLPKGTTIECVAHYDNSPNNPNNPDPTKEVHFGEQSWDEMMFGFFDVSLPDRKEPDGPDACLAASRSPPAQPRKIGNCFAGGPRLPRDPPVLSLPVFKLECPDALSGLIRDRVPVGRGRADRHFS